MGRSSNIIIIRPRPISATAAVLMEISQLRRTYYSARAFAQTQVHSLFLHSHSAMGRQSDTTGERSGAGPTLTCSQATY
ncbi:hypothetical protein B5X24_HaOG210894, partial [Helicoverpa armigera]